MNEGHPYRTPPAARVHKPRSRWSTFAALLASGASVAGPVVAITMACGLLLALLDAGVFDVLLTLDICVGIAIVIGVLLVIGLAILSAAVLLIVAVARSIGEEDESWD